MDVNNFGPNWRRSAGEAESDGVVELWREAPADGDPLITPLSIWLFLRRNLARILLASLLGGGAIFIILWLALNKYAATATIMVDPHAVVVTPGANVQPNIAADSIAIESLVQASSTPAFLSALVDKLHLVHDSEFGDREKAIEKLGKELTISRRGATYVIDVTARNRSAAKAARIANAAARAIIDNQRQIRASADAKVANDIAGRLDEVSARVSNAEEAAAELKARLHVTDVGQGTTLLERRIYELNQQLVLASAKAAEARARYEQLRHAGNGAKLAPSLQSSVLINLRDSYARLTRRAAEQAMTLGPRHPAVAALHAQIADAKRQIAAELARLVDSARNDMAAARQREDSLGRQLDAAQTESGELGPQLVKLDQLQREAKAERTVYEQLLNRQKQLVETKNLSPGDIRLVSAATPPLKIKPGGALRAAVSALLGLLCGLAYGLGREIIPGALTTPRQAERLAGVEVVGLAPLMEKPAGGPPRPDLTPWLGELCGLPMLNDDRGHASVLLISSPFRGAGRSTVAAGCAAYLAESGARVLLIKADRPAASKKRPRFGLVDVLDRGEGLRRAFVENPAAGYTILPFGGVEVENRVSASVLMSGVTLRALMRLCRQWFDVVVIDGPPALDSSHGRLLSRQADLTLLVAEWRKTLSSEIRESIERLDADRVALYFNKVDVEQLRAFDPAQSRRIEAQAEDYSLAS